MAKVPIKRAVPFTSSEENTIVFYVDNYKNILFGKGGTSQSKSNKQKIWQEIADKLNR